MKIAAFLEAQKEIQNASQDANNPHYKSKYASLESVIGAIKPIANKHGIAIIQTNGKDEHGHFVNTTLATGDEVILESRIYLILQKNDMQGLGAACTYARRFDLASIFCIGQEDDDGNSIKAKASEQQQPLKPYEIARMQASTNLPHAAAKTPQAVTPFNETPVHVAAPVTHIETAVAGLDVSTPQNDVVISFGKHAGKRVSEIKRPDLLAYVKWLATIKPMTNDKYTVLKCAEKILQDEGFMPKQ